VKGSRVSQAGLVAVVFTFLSASAFADRAVIGGPPTRDINRCDRLTRPCTDPVVIGIGHHFNGRTEIVAYHSRIGLCLDVDRPDVTQEMCGGDLPPSGPEAIRFAGFQWDKEGRDYSGSLGWLRPDVASVVLRFRRDGHHERAQAMVTQVGGHLLAQIKESEPFGFFEATIRGCVPPNRMHVVAYDDTGEVLDREQPRRLAARKCDPGSGGFDIGPVGRAQPRSGRSG
jgi:hypothetical protein